MSERATAATQRVFAAHVDEVRHGGHIVEINGLSIGLFPVGDEIVAVLNICPHELAPVCRGVQRGTSLPSAPGEFIWGREDEILACPWHQWEFDLLTGQSLTDPKVRVRTFPVEVEDGEVYVRLRGARR